MINSFIYSHHEMRKTCISLYPFQLSGEVIYSVLCYNYDTDHLLFFIKEI